MIKKRGKKALALKTVGRAILLILVFLLVMWFIWGDDLWSYVKNLPEYGGVNDSDIRLEADNITEFECPILVAKLGKIDNRFEYLIRRVHKLNVHLGNNIGRYTGLTVDVSDKDNYKIFINKFGPYNLDVGGVENNKLWIYDYLIRNYNQKGEDYELLRDTVKLDDLKRINGAYLADERTFCKTKSQFEDFDKKSQCLNSKLTCEFFDGRCVDDLNPEEAEELNKILDPEDKFKDIVSDCSEEEVGYGQLECGKERSCCVKIRDSINYGDMKIEGFKYVIAETRTEALEEGTAISLLEEDTLKYNSGDKVWLYNLGSYKEVSDSDSEFPDFCYLMKTDKGILHRGYTGSFDSWIPTIERTLELIVWIPWEENQKALKRVAVTRLTGDEGDYVPNGDFYGEVLVTETGDSFQTRFANAVLFVYGYEERPVEEFRITKVSSSRLIIEGFYEGEDGEAWRVLDCSQGWPRNSIKISKIGQTLFDTLRYCEMNND